MPTSGCGTLLERIDRRLLAVVDIEDGHQLRDLQQITHALGKIGQLNRASGVARRGVQSHQRAQATAIDVGNARQVQHQTMPFRDQLLRRIPQVSRFLAKYDAPGAIDQTAVPLRSNKF